jgi:hypothetical protein
VKITFVNLISRLLAIHEHSNFYVLRQKFLQTY